MICYTICKRNLKLLRILRKLRGVPAPAKRLYQKNACLKPTPRNVDIVSLILQKRSLPRNDLQISVDPSLITSVEEVQ